MIDAPFCVLLRRREAPVCVFCVSLLLERTGRDARSARRSIRQDVKVGALVEVNCETDFVARTEDFRALVRYVAEQVAATPADALETEASLLDQPWIRDPSRTIGDLVSEASAPVGENVRVRGFACFRIDDV
jgi:translation elongation factor EF-Ts